MKRFSFNKRLALYAGIFGLSLAVLGGGAFLLATRGDSLTRAEQAIARGDLRSGQVELRNYLRARPGDPRAHLTMAQLDMKLADPVAAQTEFEAARAVGADPAEVTPLLGEALLAQGLNRETLEQVPAGGAVPELAVRNLLLRSIAQLALKDVESAEATLSAGKALLPESMEVSLMGARLAAARGDLSETQAKVAEILSRDATQIDALLMQEQLEAGSGHAGRALEFADRAIEAAPWSAMARMRRANLLMSMGHDERAQNDVNAVLTVQPRFIEAVYLKALLLARHGNLDEAGQEMERLVGAGPRLPQALYYQAMLAARLGRMETATDLARRFNRLMPADRDGIKLLARMEMASGRPDRVLALLEPMGPRSESAAARDADMLDLLGRAYAMVGDQSSAMQSLRQAAEAAPNDAGVLARYGVTQIKAGEASGAAATLSRSLELVPGGDPMTEEALIAASIETGETARAEAALDQLKARAGETEAWGLLTGAARARRGDLEGARLAFAATMRTFPGSVGAMLDWAAVSAGLGQRADADGMLEGLLARDPANERVLTFYVTGLLREGRLAPALRALEAGHTSEPGRTRIAAMLADALTLMNEPRRAISVLEPGMDKGRPIPVMLAALARAQAAAEFNEDAKTSYWRLLRMAPGDLSSRGQLVTLLLRTGDPEGAKAAWREAAALFPGNFDVLSNWVALEVQTGGVAQGLKLAERLGAEMANRPAGAILKGDLFMREKRFNEAAQAYLAEYTAAPDVRLLLRLVGAEAAGGQFTQAERRLQEGLVQMPDKPEILQALAQFDIRAKRFADAEAHLSALLVLRSGDPLALNNLAWTYFMQGDSRARSVAQGAYQKAPGPDTADTLGWILVRGGEAAAAVPLLQQAVAGRPGNPQVQYHLAVALRDSGQGVAAADVLASVMGGTVAFDERQAASDLMAELVSEQTGVGSGERRGGTVNGAAR